MRETIIKNINVLNILALLKQKHTEENINEIHELANWLLQFGKIFNLTFQKVRQYNILLFCVSTN